MITRPLDLSTRLRPPPRSYDYLFWVNGALIALFFTFFGSRFVLSPGFAINRQAGTLPVVPSAVTGAVPTQLTLNIMEDGRLYTERGLVTFPMFREWLAEESKRVPGATILLRAPALTPVASITEIMNAAEAVGFTVQMAANVQAAERGESGIP